MKHRGRAVVVGVLVAALVVAVAGMLLADDSPSDGLVAFIGILAAMAVAGAAYLVHITS